MLRGAQTVANRDKISTRVSRQDCQKTTQDECQKTSFRNRAEQYWLRPLLLFNRIEPSKGQTIVSALVFPKNTTKNSTVGAN